MVRPWFSGFIVFALATTAAAQGDLGAGTGLSAANDLDPLEIARRVRLRGDEAVLRSLGPEIAFGERLGAIEGSLWLAEPERALDSLSQTASGRDSILAGRAASAALGITRGLTAAGLSSREVFWSDLEPSRARFSTLADDDSARSDIRMAAALAVDALDALLTTAPRERGTPPQRASRRAD